jgi:hypothetical protein
VRIADDSREALRGSSTREGRDPPPKTVGGRRDSGETVLGKGTLRGGGDFETFRLSLSNRDIGAVGTGCICFSGGQARGRD